MALLKPPFRGNDLDVIFKKVQKGVYDPIPSFYSPELANMINMLLTVQAKKRPTAEQILQNSIIV